MFNQISWASYIQIVALVLLTYYVFTLYKYYRHDLVRFLKRKQNLPANELAFTSINQRRDGYREGMINHSDFMPQDDSNSGYFPLVQALTDEVQAFISEAGNNNFDRDQILPSLQLLLSKYPSVSASPYKESIQNLIEQECEKNCSVHLSKGELDGLWVQ